MVDQGGERAGQRGSIPLTNQGGQRGLSHRATFLRNPELRELLPLGCTVNGEWTSEEAWQTGRTAEWTWRGTIGSGTRKCCAGNAWVPVGGLCLSNNQEGSWLWSLGEALRKQKRAKGLSGLEWWMMGSGLKQEKSETGVWGRANSDIAGPSIGSCFKA